MCRAKDETGRRCKSSHPEYRRAKRAEAKQRRLAEAAVEGTPATAGPVAADTTQTRAARMAAEERFSDWNDYSRIFEVSAMAANTDYEDLKSALVSGRPVGAWTVKDRFDESDGYAWALVQFDHAALTQESRDHLDNELGWESDEGVAVYAPDGTVQVSLNGAAAEAFRDARFARVAGPTTPRFTADEVAAANKRADHAARVVAAQEAARQAEADRKAVSLNANRAKVSGARAVANDLRKRIAQVETREDYTAALDAIYEADLTERTQEKLSDALDARRREVSAARASAPATPVVDRARDTTPPVPEAYDWSRHQAHLDALVDADDTPPRRTYVDDAGQSYESVEGREWVQWLRTKADQGNPAAAVLYTTGIRQAGWQSGKYHTAADAIRALRYQARTRTPAQMKALATSAKRRHEEAAVEFAGNGLGESNAREARIAGLVIDAAA